MPAAAPVLELHEQPREQLQPYVYATVLSIAWHVYTTTFTSPIKPVLGEGEGNPGSGPTESAKQGAKCTKTFFRTTENCLSHGEELVTD